MLGITDLKSGTFFELEGTPHQVLSFEHSKTGRAGSVLRTKIRNLRTGATYERTFKGSEQFPEADIARRSGQFLYLDERNGTFMESESYEQFELALDRLGSSTGFLTEGQTVDLMLYNDQLLAVDLPPKVELKVAYTEPGYKGDTQSSAMKPAEMETGLTVQVPLFIKQGDTVRVNTGSGLYVERVNV